MASDRVLRHLASTYTVAEVGPSTFAANETTRLLSSPAGKGNILFGFNILNEAFHKLPDFLKETGHKNPNQTLDTAFHRAYDTKLQFFLFMQRDQEVIRYFHPSLAAFKSPIAWTSVVPLAEKLQHAEKTVPLFVDVGGGHGAQCVAFRDATSAQFSGRVINQDLPETLAEAPKYGNIEMMAQDFYEKQQVQGKSRMKHESKRILTIPGAKVYYIRQCLHDLPDEGAKKVLRRIKDAMSPDSLLWIDEMVIPETGASPFAMQLDFTMMTMFNSTERTLLHWKECLEDVGLQINQVYRYDPELEYSILEAVPARK